MSEFFFFSKRPLLSEVYGSVVVSRIFYLYFVHSKFGFPLLLICLYDLFLRFLSRHVNDVQFIQILFVQALKMTNDDRSVYYNV